jgi:FkbM family methyltransferase
MGLNAISWTGRALRKVGSELLRHSGIKGTWVDVGAHHGETTIGYARHNPGLIIYEIEPNLRAAARMMGHAPNVIVVPMAVAEKDGCAEFHINAFEQSSSLLAINEEARRTWVGVEKLNVEAIITVPTIRLDTFMGLIGIKKIDLLKIDTQGMDLAVLRSAGSRLRDIEKITLEVEVAPVHFYLGAPSKDEVLRFLGDAGFGLIGTESQTNGQEENLTFVRKYSS